LPSFPSRRASMCEYTMPGRKERGFLLAHETEPLQSRWRHQRIGPVLPRRLPCARVLSGLSWPTYGLKRRPHILWPPLVAVHTTSPAWFSTIITVECSKSLL
jgi:hypothetical protein